MRKKQQPTTSPQPVAWTRADPTALAAFDPRTKQCTMNCGPHKDDPRSKAERMLLCHECLVDIALVEKTPPVKNPMAEWPWLEKKSADMELAEECGAETGVWWTKFHRPEQLTAFANRLRAAPATAPTPSGAPADTTKALRLLTEDEAIPCWLAASQADVQRKLQEKFCEVNGLAVQDATPMKGQQQ